MVCVSAGGRALRLVLLLAAHCRSYAYSPAGRSPEPRRSTFVSQRGYYGEARMR
jgi:hypothetical protein